MEPLRNFPPENGEISLKDMIERALEMRDEARWMLAAERRAREAAQQDEESNLEVPPPQLKEPDWQKPKSGRQPLPFPYNKPDGSSGDILLGDNDDLPPYLMDRGILMPGDSLPIPKMPRNDDNAEIGCNGLLERLNKLGWAIDRAKERIQSLEQGPKNRDSESELRALREELEPAEQKMDEMKKSWDRLPCSV